MKATEAGSSTGGVVVTGRRASQLAWLPPLDRDTFKRLLATAWRWRVVLLMNLYLISPVLMHELRLRDKTLIFTLSASLLWLGLVQLLVRRVWVAHALMAPLYLATGVDLYVIANYQTRLASSMLLTIVENMGDARDFMEGDFIRTVGSLVLMFGTFAYCLWKIRDLRVTLPSWLAVAPLAGLCVVYGGVAKYMGSWNLTLLNDRNSPFGVFSQAYLTVSLHREELAAREQAKSFRFGAKREAAPAEPETYVLVVGESARRHNFSLYGYERETNPRLSKLPNLIVFKDVITQVAQTQFSVPLIITRGSLMDGARTARETSIVSAFREVGFHTFWLSTQQRETAMAAISRYAIEADVVRFFERQHDGALSNALKSLLQQPSDTSTKRFFLLHTLGSHFNLTSRYPRSFARFPDGEESGVLHGTSASVGYRELIGAYDNTILYTDHVLGEIIDELQRRPGIKALLYVPDHGDNLRDDERDYFGHAHSNEYDLPIPLVFWYSDEFAQKYPEKIEAAKKNVDRPLNTRTIFYSLAQMANISIPDPDLPKLSVFSPELTNVKRMVAKQPQPIDYDEWAQRTGTKVPRVIPPK
jgi:heptose-I-phosphate ethanolaminephosphotransferase